MRWADQSEEKLHSELSRLYLDQIIYTNQRTLDSTVAHEEPHISGFRQRFVSPGWSEGFCKRVCQTALGH